MKRNLNLNRSEAFLSVLALITGFIHLKVGYEGSFTTLVLAGIGFLVGAVLFTFLEKYREYIVALSVPYTASQFYFAYQTYGMNWTRILVFDKSVQLLFIFGGIYYLYSRGFSLPEVESIGG